MLSYRHAYHAGNHADILKHYCLFEVLTYFVAKNKDFSYIDTHAGAGLYDLTSEQANKNEEYKGGVLKLFHSGVKLNDRLESFKQFLRPFINSNQYPGSPYIANQLMPNDYLRFLYELHPRDFSILKQNMSRVTVGKNIKLFCSDGLKGLLALIPPLIRRAVIVLDPCYEVKTDYRQVLETVCLAHKKFSTGCYLVWYPLLCRSENQYFTDGLREISPKYLQVELSVTGKNSTIGMYGGGMWIINPTYQLDTYLHISLPQLLMLLKQNSLAHFVLRKGCL